jgi:UPF0755 protein
MLKRLFVIVILLSVIASVGGYVLYRDFLAFAEHPLNLGAESRIYRVERGATVTRIARDLTSMGALNRPPQYLIALARVEKFASRIRAGEYRLDVGLSSRGLLELFASGRVVQHSLTVLEGWSFAELLEAVGRHPILEPTLAGLDPEQIFVQLGFTDDNPEGRFLSDTYHFPRGTTDLEFLQRGIEAMDSVLAQEWEKRAEGLPLKTPYEALILASIIEKETGLDKERPEIAGVFIRRLNLGMKLQTDPTVIYGMGTAFDGNLRRRDLRADTPYNTYTRKGLPPTPIALPGRAAIVAALHPAAGETLFFVARGDGSHQFSSTLDEHNRAVRKFQLKQ